MKPNILIVSTSLKTQGGISSVVREHMNSKLTKEYNLYHLPTHINGSNLIKMFYLVKSYCKFPYIILSKNISIIHIHGGMKSSFFRKSYFMIVGKLLNKKVIFHMHSAKIDEFMINSNLIKKNIIIHIFNRYDAIIAISNYWKNVLGKYTNSKVVVIYNPIYLTDKTINHVRPTIHFNILTMGELCARKGTEKIMKAASLLENENVIFNICGNGDIPTYKKLANDYNIQNKLRFKGWIDGKKKEEIIKQSHVYFLPSLNEGLPMSIIEAMAYGLPIISTNIGGIPEIVIHNYNGFIHHPDDITGMTESILKLINDSNLLSEMGKHSFKIVQDRLNINHIANNISDLYKELYN